MIGVNKTCNDSAIFNELSSSCCSGSNDGTCTGKDSDLLSCSSIQECAEICNGVTSGFTFGSIAEFDVGLCQEDGCFCNCEKIEECDATNRTSVSLYHLPHPDRGNKRATKTVNSFSCLKL